MTTHKEMYALPDRADKGSVQSTRKKTGFSKFRKETGPEYES